MSTISKAIQDLEEQKKRIDSAIRILRDLEGGGRGGARGGFRNLSAEGRKRIADAQKRRWAKVRAAQSGKK